MSKTPTTSVTYLIGKGEYEEAAALIREAYRRHLTREAVAKSLGAGSVTIVGKWLKRLKDAGVPDPRAGLSIARAGRRVEKFAGNGVAHVSAAVREKAIAARRMGVKLADIAAALGISEATASRIARGVKRPRKDRPHVGAIVKKKKTKGAQKNLQ